MKGGMDTRGHLTIFHLILSFFGVPQSYRAKFRTELGTEFGTVALRHAEE